MQFAQFWQKHTSGNLRQDTCLQPITPGFVLELYLVKLARQRTRTPRRLWPMTHGASDL